MKRKIFLGYLVIIFTGCNTNSTIEIPKKSDKTPFDYMFMQRAYPTGEINYNVFKEAINHKQSMNYASRNNQSTIWEFVGPDNVGGRITDIEIPVDQSETYYVGTASGGIFKTTDSAENWNPIFDNSTSLSIGDLEISKTNTDIIWVGTGEPNGGGDARNGDGIYKSIDGGLNWTNKGLSNVGSISKILIDPNDENTVFAATMGVNFKNDSNRGIYKTTNNGSTWEQVLFISDSTGVIDMVNHPTQSNILYAATWERIRRPQYRVYGGETSGIYKSIDGGNNWVELTNGLPNIANDKGRISIDISKSNPNVLYTRYADASGNIKGVYRTNNNGDTWTEVNSSQLINVGFHWWFKGIHIDPLDENIIYNLDFIVQKSIDGGNSWFNAFNSVHVDQHTLAFNTQTINEVLLGNDGGFYKSNDNGNSYTKYNLPITQFYRLYVDPQNSNKIYGGTQDNGTIRTISGDINNWQMINGGDGFQTLIDANNTNVIYVLSQYGNLKKSLNNGISFTNARNGILNSDRNNWDTPLVFDPQDSETLYYGTQRIWKTIDAAQNWAAISPDLTNGSGDGNLSFGTTTSIDVSPINSDFIIVGTDDANVWVTQNGGTDWTNVSNTLPNFWITKVLADRTDENSIYITFSGYRDGENLGHVFKSMNAGASWTDIGNGLPDVPVNDILKDSNGNLYIATDLGVFLSNDDGINWIPFGSNMPSVIVTDLHIQESEEYLYAATYGRSAYKIDISENPMSISDNSLIKEIEVYPNPASEIIKFSSSEYFIKGDVIFYDNYGKIIYESSISKNNNTVNISQLSPGIYYVKISILNNSVVRKLIVQ